MRTQEMRKMVSMERNKEIKGDMEEQRQTRPAFPRGHLNYLKSNTKNKYLVLSGRQASI